MCRYLRPFRLTVRCRLGDYIRTMMTKRILTIFAATTACVAGVSLAPGQQGVSAPSAPVYSSAPPGYSPAPSGYPPAPPSYPPGGYPADYRRGGPGVPDFDSLDDEAANSSLV